MKNLILAIAVLVVFASCSSNDVDPTDFNILSNLPADTGGIQKPFYLGSTTSPYGFYAYTPSSYTADGAEFPLIIFLHGSGERGNSQTDQAKLDLVLRNGPPMMIKKEKWNPTYPALVVSPQCHDGGWNADKLHEFIEFLVKTYQVNESRIYLTGLSMGGGGTFTYLTEKGSEAYVAAAVPICGWANANKAEGMKHIPVWTFHGDKDTTVKPGSAMNMISKINELTPKVPAKLTIYPGVGHNSWSKTYDGTGMGTESAEYDAFSVSIYDWMFQYQREISVEVVAE
ncbi:dienelactone hydrolase family protein [Flammeovirgaceae bacterium SG7u.111]|nr:dienelactone hydrolase family protein [Flammeovirgaceae bacterium SG7u.132]WPO34774.1 dienelactone hydrolase family protein [Flammeovirgaceae bacterium SG7u.111]